MGYSKVEKDTRGITFLKEYPPCHRVVGDHGDKKVSPRRHQVPRGHSREHEGLPSLIEACLGRGKDEVNT